jgi:mannose-6-phosphate isomerase-like protein (cupin superfamily)
MLPSVRRVVTGETSEGQHLYTHVQEVKPLEMGGGARYYGVWGWEQLPSLPYCNTEPYNPRSVFPAADGLRVNTVVFPPGYGVTKAEGQGSRSEDYARLMAAQDPGGERHDGSPMHATDSIDFAIVVSGEVTLVQGDGSEVVLRAGDVCVQNGAQHLWENRGDQPCMICIVVLGTPRGNP